MATSRSNSTAAAPANLQEEIQKRRPFDLIEEEVHLNLIRTAQQQLDAAEAILKTRGLSSATYNTLRILRGAQTNDGAGHGRMCSEIGEQLVSRVPDVTRLVDRLAGRGLVERRRCERDRRVVFVRILPPGLELLARIDAPIRALPERLFAQLSPTQLAQFNELLVLARRDCEPS